PSSSLLTMKSTNVNAVGERVPSHFSRSRCRTRRCLQQSTLPMLLAHHQAGGPTAGHDDVYFRVLAFFSQTYDLGCSHRFGHKRPCRPSWVLKALGRGDVGKLLRLSGFIDAVNDRFGVIAIWLVLICCLVSTGIAISRYALSISSNAWIESQWYM